MFNCNAAKTVRVALHYELLLRMKIQISYTGRNYQTAEQLPSELDLDDGSTVADALRQITAGLSDDLQLPTSCLIAVAGEHLGSLNSYTDRPLEHRDEIILIAPVAGG